MSLLSDHVRVLSFLLNDLVIIIFFKTHLMEKGNKCFSLGSHLKVAHCTEVLYENSFVPIAIRDNCQQPGCSFSGTKNRLSLLKMLISLCLLLYFHSKDLSSFTSGCEGIIYNLAEHRALKNAHCGEPTPALLLGR